MNDQRKSVGSHFGQRKRFNPVNARQKVTENQRPVFRLIRIITGIACFKKRHPSGWRVKGMNVGRGALIDAVKNSSNSELFPKIAKNDDRAGSLFRKRVASGMWFKTMPAPLPNRSRPQYPSTAQARS